MNKQGIVFFVEGETEEIFYKKVIKYLHDKYGGFNIDKIDVKNVRGITNFKEKVVRKFEKNYILEYKNYDFVVVLCYDTDIFEYSQCPKINWKDVEKILLKLGAKKVIHLKAEKSIEDWFLIDEDGVKRYLKLSTDIRLKGVNGQEKIINLFKKANKTYVKGKESEEFINSLNIEKIINAAENSFSEIYKILKIK